MNGNRHRLSKELEMQDSTISAFQRVFQFFCLKSSHEAGRGEAWEPYQRSLSPLRKIAFPIHSTKKFCILNAIPRIQSPMKSYHASIFSSAQKNRPLVSTAVAGLCSTSGSENLGISL